MKNVGFTKQHISVFLEVKRIINQHKVKYIKITKSRIIYKETNGGVKCIDVGIKNKTNIKGVQNKKFRRPRYVNEESENDELSFDDNDKSEQDMELDVNDNVESNHNFGNHVKSRVVNYELPHSFETYIYRKVNEGGENDEDDGNDNYGTHVENVVGENVVVGENDEDDGNDNCGTHVENVVGENVVVGEKVGNVIIESNGESNDNCGIHVEKRGNEGENVVGEKVGNVVIENNVNFGIRSDQNYALGGSNNQQINNCTSFNYFAYNFNYQGLNRCMLNPFSEFAINNEIIGNRRLITDQNSGSNNSASFNYIAYNFNNQGQGLNGSFPFSEYGNEIDRIILDDSTNDDKYEYLKQDVLSLEDLPYRNTYNLIYENEYCFYNIIKNCLTTEVHAEIYNCEVLMNYFRIGAYLNKIWIIINDDVDISERPDRNKVTGIIKGTGIAKSHVDIFGQYGINESKRARDFYKKSTRVYNIYKWFPSALVQICRAKLMSANKLLEMNGKEFEAFSGGIEKYVANNINNYKSQSVINDELINFTLITDDIIAEVKKFTRNPTLMIQ